MSRSVRARVGESKPLWLGLSLLILSTAPSRAVAQVPNPCEPDAEWVVTSQQEMLEAMFFSQPGDTIAVEGSIEWDGLLGVGLFVPEVTLTCAAPGAEIVAITPILFPSAMVTVLAPDVTISGLRLVNDGWVVSLFRGRFGDTDYDGSDATVIGNQLEGCPDDACIVVSGAAGAQIAYNQVRSSSASSGVHAQARIDASGTWNPDGLEIRDNVFVSEGPPSFIEQFGAIRVRDGDQVTVENNEVVGTWHNGLRASSMGALKVDANDFGANLVLVENTVGALFQDNTIAAPDVDICLSRTTRANSVKAPDGEANTVCDLGVRNQFLGAFIFDCPVACGFIE